MPDKVNSSYYVLINKLIDNLSFSHLSNINNDFVLDFESKNVYLTDTGFQKIELLFKKSNMLDVKESLYDVNNIEFLHIVYASLKAKFFLKKMLIILLKIMKY